MISVTDPIIVHNRSSAYWQCSWRANGRRRFKNLGPASGRHALTKTEARKLARQHENDLNDDAADLERKSIAQYEDIFFKLRAGMNDSTERTYRRTFALLGEHFGEDLPMSAVDRLGAEEFRVAMLERGSVATAHKYVRQASAIFNSAIPRKYAAENPFSGLECGSVAAKVGYVPEDVARRVLDELPGPHWKGLFALARFCGLRVPSETASLTWGRVVFDKRMLVVLDQKRSRKEKGLAKERQVYLDPRAEPYLLELSENRPPRTESVLGLDVTSREIHTVIEGAITRAGLTRWPRLTDALRESAEQDWANAGYPQHAVSSWIGHSMRVSEKHYLRVGEMPKPVGCATVVQPPQANGNQIATEPRRKDFSDCLF